MDSLIPTRLRRLHKIHFIGIGGSGMSGIAELLLRQGYEISGSDRTSTSTTDRLINLGAKVSIGHDSAHVESAQVVVVSSAISQGNIEFQSAKAARIPIVPRALMLAECMRFRYGIAVAGSHGKTTTTSLLAEIFSEAELDPTYVIGGKLNAVNSNAALGQGRYFIAEADESDASFLHLQPMAAVITNVDHDHLPAYDGSFDNLTRAFLAFAHQLPFDGYVVVCGDDPAIAALLPALSCQYMTYGFGPDNDYQIQSFKQIGLSTQFVISNKSGDLESFQVNLPGKHNALNATAAMLVAKEEGVSLEAIQKALLHFAGINRRFQWLGDHTIGNNTFKIYDDYGHHPTEVAATIESAKAAWPDRRVVMIYQPHRFSRTMDTFDDSAKILASVDLLCLLDIYPAGEEPIPGISSKSLATAVRQYGALQPLLIADQSELLSLLSHNIENDDIVIFQGAGDIGVLATQFAQSVALAAEPA